MSFKQFLNEASLGRVYQHTQGRNIGIISASRGERTAEENHQHTLELAHHARKAGFGYIHIKGRYIENHGTPQARPVDEHSLLVIGKHGDDHGALKKFLTHHGEKHGQDSVLYKHHDSEHAHLIGTREGGFPGKGQIHPVGKWHPNRAGEFHSVMRSKKTFAFESIEYLTPVSFGARAQVLF